MMPTPLAYATTTCGSSVLTAMSGSWPASMSCWSAVIWLSVSVPRLTGVSKPGFVGELSAAATSSGDMLSAAAMALASADVSAVGLEVGVRTTTVAVEVSGAKSAAPSSTVRARILPVPSSDTIVPVASTARISGGESA